LYTDFDF